MAEIRIGRTLYPSKKAVKERARDILKANQKGRTLRGTDLDFVSALLDLHPHRDKKIGIGVSSLYVRPAPGDAPGGSYCFWIRRKDGTSTDFSYHACLRPVDPDAYHRADVLRAMREAVVGQVVSFGTNESHVDHVIPFIELAGAFLEAAGLEWAEVGVVCSGDGSTGRRLEAGGLRERWANFHEKLAVLRNVSVTTNLTRKRLKWKSYIYVREDCLEETP